MYCTKRDSAAFAPFSHARSHIVATSIIGSDDLLETTEKVATAEYFDLLALDNQLFARLLQPRPLKLLIL